VRETVPRSRCRNSVHKRNGGERMVRTRTWALWPIIALVLSLSSVLASAQQIDVRLAFDRQPTEWFDPARPPADVAATGGTALCRIRYEMEFSSGPISTNPSQHSNGEWSVRYALAEATVRLTVRTQKVLPLGASEATEVHEQGHAEIAEVIGKALAPLAIQQAFTGVAGEGTGATVVEADRLASEAFNASVQASMQQAGDELDDWSFYYNDLEYHARLSALGYSGQPSPASVQRTAWDVGYAVETEGVELSSCMGTLARQIAETRFSASAGDSSPAKLPDSGASILFEAELPAIVQGAGNPTSVERHCASLLSTKGETTDAARVVLASLLWRRWAAI